MALDSDASGYIALTEIDSQCASMLAEFRRWANLFFGSVMDAFRALDSDGGGSLSRAEFKKSVTKYCFRGDREGLFTLLDVACDGDISVEEMAFLDEWEISEVNDEPTPSFQEVEVMLNKHKSEADSDSSDDEDPLLEDTAAMQEVSVRAPRRHVMLNEDELPMLAEEIANLHRPMPGTSLMELLGGVSDRSRANYLPSAVAHETSFMSASSFGQMSSRVTSASHSCSRGSQRPRSKRLRPYIGGAPFMSRHVRTPKKRAANSRHWSNFLLPLPALVLRPQVL